MADFWFQLFDGSDFPPRWHCGRWSAFHGYLHIVSDLLIFGAYLAIPVLIASLLLKTKATLPAPFPSLGKFFAAFIVCCGLTHLNEAIIFYHPIYRWAGVVKLVTAIVSWSTIIALVPALPKIAALTPPSDLEARVVAATTALKKEREIARAAEDLFRKAIEASPSGMLAIDEEGQIVLANEEATRIFGYSELELLGMSVEEVIPDQFRKQHPRLRAAYLERPTARKMGGNVPLSGKRKDGAIFPLEVGLNPLATPHGRLVLSAIVDRTESVRQQTELEERTAQLQRSNEELESFASAVSHDLKAPLRAVQHAVTWIEEDLAESELSDDMKENLDLLRSRTTRMEGLMDGLLNYARIGREQDSLESFSARAALDNVLLLLGPEAKRAVRVEGELPTLRTARSAFEQVLFNLVSNALKHGERGDVTIEISATQRKSLYEFSVRDNGVGIDPRFHERIFEVFQTLESRDEKESVGMGLALVKKVVEGRGGNVWVQSKQGEGALFQFTWPLDPAREAE